MFNLNYYLWLLFYNNSCRVSVYGSLTRGGPDYCSSELLLIINRSDFMKFLKILTIFAVDRYVCPPNHSHHTTNHHPNTP